MQTSHRSSDNQGVCQVNDPNEQEREHLVDNVWYERRDESTLDEITHEAKFHKELMGLFKITETAAVATLALSVVMAQNLAKQNEKEPKQTYQTWHQLLRESLNQVAERLEIPFPMLLYNISPFLLPNFVQAEYDLDEQQLRLYMEAMERATVSEILAYLMAVGLHAVCKGPSSLLQKLIFDKESLCLLSFLVYAQN